jgi:hypothetical protein
VTVKATDSMDTGLSSCHFVATVYTPGFSAWNSTSTCQY